jgi:ATP-dependent DNA helicase RecQ
MTARLVARGVAAVAFHAGLGAEEKRRALARFRTGEPIVVVATIAFGMGIDRPDVRFVLHLDMPDSPEAYYQQIGRAGRDGEIAETLLLYGGEDIARARHWIAQSAAPNAQKAVMRARLEAMIGFTETPACRTRTLLACFGEDLAADCGHCDTCLDQPVLGDGTIAAQKILSAVHRTGQRFGTAHITAVVRGERTDAVERHGHDGLPTFGVGVDRAPAFWRGVIRRLVALGALDIDTEGHGGLFIVPDRARPILRGDAAVMLREGPGANASGRRGPAEAAPPLAVTGGLFDALRAWRAAEAKAQRVPPYLIFHDRVLRDIVAGRPMNRAELAAIKGVGTSKLDRYATAVLGIVARGSDAA